MPSATLPGFLNPFFKKGLRIPKTFIGLRRRWRLIVYKKITCDKK